MEVETLAAFAKFSYSSLVCFEGIVVVECGVHFAVAAYEIGYHRASLSFL